MDYPLCRRFQQIVEHQTHESKAYHAVESDDSIAVPKQPPVIPKSHPQKMDSGKPIMYSTIPVIAAQRKNSKTGFFFIGFMA